MMFHVVGLTFLVNVLCVVVFIPWILMTKRNSTAAVAWCLVVLFLPLLGALLFWVFGYAHISRPLRRVRRQRSAFRARHPPRQQEAARGDEEAIPTWCDLGEVACK